MTMGRFQVTVLLLALGLPTPAPAQQGPIKSSPAPHVASPEPEIQDNSFFVEEAYNQDPYTVQHITTFTRFWNSRDAIATFTQEWPIPEHARHQLSYTLAGMSAGAFPGSGPGFGDIVLNYRYQLVGGAETRIAFAPRFSMLLPSGQARFGRGFGGAGFQGSLPVSIVISPRWLTHFNVGTTLIPSARNELGERASMTGYNLGQSFIFLAHPRFNLMFETVWSGSESVVANGQTQRAHQLFMSSGIRWSYNLAHGLQIVPGLAVPFGVGPSAGEKGVVLYLSFEHPFGKGRT
jgi:hypothetical protein